MKHNRMNTHNQDESYDSADSYKFSGYEDDDYYEDLLEEKLGSKWRKRPKRSKHHDDEIEF